MFQFDYTRSFGGPTQVALARETYCTGNTALIMVCADQTDEMFGEMFGVLSVNITDDGFARCWTLSDEANFIVDTNNNSDEVVRVFIDAGIIEIKQGMSAHSGFCSYPFARLTDKGMAEVPSYDELMKALRAEVLAS